MRGFVALIPLALLACYPRGETVQLTLEADSLQFVGVFQENVASSVYALSTNNGVWTVNGSSDPLVDIGPTQGLPIALPDGVHQFLSLRLGTAIFVSEVECASATQLEIDLEIRSVESVGNESDCKVQQTNVTLLADQFCPLMTAARPFREVLHPVGGPPTTNDQPNVGWNSIYARAAGCL